MARPQKSLPIQLLKCCSCDEIPWTEIFQCSNAHLICEKCYSKLVKCPQCKIQLDQKVKIRSAMEHILNTREFDCPRRGQGCKEKLARNMVSNHIQQECTYRSLRNVQLCKQIGFKCDFYISPGKISEALQHFQQEHGASLQNSRAFAISLKNITSRATLLSSQNFVSSLVIVQSDNNIRGTFLLFVKVNGKENTMQMKFCFLEDSSLVQNPCSNFQICLDSALGSNLIWKEHLTEIWDGGNLLKTKSFKVPLQLLNETSDTGKVLINVVIAKSGENIEFQEGEKYIIESDIHQLELGGLRDSCKSKTGPFPSDYFCKGCGAKSLIIFFVSLTHNFHVLCSSCIDVRYERESIYAVITSHRQEKLFRELAFTKNKGWATLFNDTVKSEYSKKRKLSSIARKSTGGCNLKYQETPQGTTMHCDSCNYGIIGYSNSMEKCTIELNTTKDEACEYGEESFDQIRDDTWGRAKKSSNEETSFDSNTDREKNFEEKEYLCYLKRNLPKSIVSYRCLECLDCFICNDCASSGYHSESGHMLAFISQKKHLFHFKLDGGSFLRRMIGLISRTMEDCN